MSVFNIISPKDADWGDHVGRFKRFRIDRFILHPDQWASIPGSATLSKLTWNRVRFDTAGVNSLPDDKAGVYTIFAEPEIAKHSSVRYLLYVGETHGKSTALRSRVRSYLNEKTNSKPRVHIVEMIDRYPNHLWIYYAIVSRKHVQKIEDDLLAAFLPPFNRKFPAIIKDMVKAVFS